MNDFSKKEIIALQILSNNLNSLKPGRDTVGCWAKHLGIPSDQWMRTSDDDGSIKRRVQCELAFQYADAFLKVIEKEEKQK